jgi:hypothetical protein
MGFQYRKKMVRLSLDQELERRCGVQNHSYKNGRKCGNALGIF